MLFRSVRKKLNSKTWRLKKLKIDNKIILEKMDLEKIEDINMIFYKYKINEVYNLASQSFVNTSFSTPIKTTNITAMGVIRILETIKIYQEESKVNE